MKYLMIGLVALASAAAAEPSKEAVAFGAREAIEQISLSPDGKNIAVLAPNGPRGSVVSVINLQGEPVVRVIARSTGKPDQLTGCKWASNTQLICSAFFIADDGDSNTGFTRLVAVDADGKNMKVVTAIPSENALGIVYRGGEVIDWTGDGSGSKVLMTRQFVPEQSTGSNISDGRLGLGVELIDLANLRRSVVEAPRPNIVDYIADGRGKVRIMEVRSRSGDGYDRSETRYLYRKKDSRDWLPLSTVKLLPTGLSTGFEPVAVDPDLDVAYGFDVEGSRTALFKIALDGSLKRELVYARADADIDSTLRIGRQRRVVGASFATDKRQNELFDPALKKLARGLAKAMPGLPLVRIVDASADEQTILLWLGSDSDPGKFYLFTRADSHLTELLPVRPELNAYKRASVTPITYPAADGTMIPGYLTLPAGSDGKNLPAIVMPHGGPAARDEWNFDWLPQFFAARGYAVLQPNYRGSTGYGDGWFQKNGFQSWRTAMNDIADGGRWLTKQGIAAPGKLAIVGWSYGGYAALQVSAVDADLFKAVVAVAPVTDLDKLREEAVRYANYNIVDAFIGKGPHVAEGSPARHAATIKAPVLLFHGDRDLNVGVAESRLMADRLRDAKRQVDYVEFAGLDHYLDDSSVRAQMLDRADTFLKSALAIQ